MDAPSQTLLVDLATATSFVEEIPMVSEVHEEVRRLIDHDEGGAEDLARLVERDAMI